MNFNPKFLSKIPEFDSHKWSLPFDIKYSIVEIVGLKPTRLRSLPFPYLVYIYYTLFFEICQLFINGVAPGT